jgi:hypothetical protein
MTNEAYQSLHDKRTRGLALSAEEQASLDAWYAKQDDEEMAALAIAPATTVLTNLQTQVQAINAELQCTAQHIEEVTAANIRLRDEIIRLQGQATKQSKAQPA